MNGFARRLVFTQKAKSLFVVWAVHLIKVRVTGLAIFRPSWDF